MAQSIILHKTLAQVEAHYPELINNMGKDQIDFLGNSELNPWSGRVIFEVTDIHREEIIHVEGLEHLGYDPNEWTFKRSLESVPGAYGKLHESYLWGSNNLFYFNRLQNHGMGLKFEKEVLLRHISGKIYRANHEERIVISSSNSTPVIRTSKFTLHEEWQIHYPPIAMRPLIYVHHKQRDDLERALIQLATPDFLTIGLGMVDPRYKLVLHEHLNGLKNNQISKALNESDPTVIWLNREIKKVCHEQLSTYYDNAAQWAKFFKMIGVLSHPGRQPFYSK